MAENKGNQREIFYFENLIYDVTGLKRVIRNNKMRYLILRAPLTQELLHHLSKYFEPDQERIASLSPDEIEVPCIAVEVGDGTTRVVDGFHRIQRRSQDGLTDVPMYLVQVSDAAPCVKVRR